MILYHGLLLFTFKSTLSIIHPFYLGTRPLVFLNHFNGCRVPTKMNHTDFTVEHIVYIILLFIYLFIIYNT